MAAGDGRLIKGLLYRKFYSIDCFDQSFEAIRKLESLTFIYDQIKIVD